MNAQLSYYLPTLQTVSQSAHRSPWLLTLGVINVFVNGLVFIWSVCVTFYWTTTVALDFTTACTIFHLLVGALSIIGSLNGIRYRNYLVVSIILNPVGLFLFVGATMGIGVLHWGRQISECNHCLGDQKQCPGYCYIDKDLVFAPILAYALFQGIVCLLTIIISCCNVHYNCGYCYTGKTPPETLI